MITLSPQLCLQPIEARHHRELFELMKLIYPSAYSHFWKDDCSWYLNKVYGTQALLDDLNQEDGFYYFVRFRESVIGIFKLSHNYTYPFLPELKALKVHRIYLDPSVQGKGIGKQLMEYAEERALLSKHTLIWLDAMDTHTQAQRFYTSLGYVKGDLHQLDFKLLHDKHRAMWYLHKML